MKIKTSELTGVALDWAVAKCEGVDVEVHSRYMIIKRLLQSLTQKEVDTLPPPKPYLVVPGVGNASYSTDWAQGGPIIEREGVRIDPPRSIVFWSAETNGYWAPGPTPLIAAMRCIVSSKLGDEVDVPDELAI